MLLALGLVHSRVSASIIDSGSLDGHCSNNACQLSITGIFGDTSTYSTSEAVSTSTTSKGNQISSAISSAAPDIESLAFASTTSKAGTAGLAWTRSDMLPNFPMSIWNTSSINTSSTLLSGTTDPLSNACDVNSGTNQGTVLLVTTASSGTVSSLRSINSSTTYMLGTAARTPSSAYSGTEQAPNTSTSSPSLVQPTHTSGGSPRRRPSQWYSVVLSALSYLSNACTRPMGSLEPAKPRSTLTLRSTTTSTTTVTRSIVCGNASTFQAQ